MAKWKLPCKRDEELTSPYGDNNHPLPPMRKKKHIYIVEDNVGVFLTNKESWDRIVKGSDIRSVETSSLRSLIISYINISNRG